jgi:methylated-DNA-[protein]-cysteine S-methyltransferase
MQIVSTRMNTAVGPITITANDTHLLAVRFLPSEHHETVNPDVKSTGIPTNDRDQVYVHNVDAQTHTILSQATAELSAYFSGKKVDFRTPLAPAGTAFQQQVWAALIAIPYGQTISYLQLAQRLGDEKTIRAAASANGKNPIAILIPCHRVIGSDGSLTGYAGGLHRKVWLLALEGKVRQGNLFR